MAVACAVIHAGDSHVTNFLQSLAHRLHFRFDRFLDAIGVVVEVPRKGRALSIPAQRGQRMESLYDVVQAFCSF